MPVPEWPVWRDFKPFRVERKETESEIMTSFYLVPEDGVPAPAFEPGQYLSVKLRPPGYPYDQIRRYSISRAPNGRYYRTSVKREDAPQGVPGAPPGLVSNHLHGAVGVGDTLLVHVPLGDFVLDAASDRPVVSLSGDAGVTAVLGMLEHLAGPGGGSRGVVFLRGVRGRARHPFAEHVRALIHRRPGIRGVVLYERVGPDDVQGVHHDTAGRTTADAIRAHLPEREETSTTVAPRASWRPRRPRSTAWACLWSAATARRSRPTRPSPPTPPSRRPKHAPRDARPGGTAVPVHVSRRGPARAPGRSSLAAGTACAGWARPRAGPSPAR